MVFLPHLSLLRGTEDVSWKTEDILEELVQNQGLESLQSYLEKVKFKTIVVCICPPDRDTGCGNFLLLLLEHIILPVTIVNNIARR